MSTAVPGSIITKAQGVLRQAALAMEDVRSENPERRVAGMRNVIVWGRAVTNVLQGLRSVVDDFEPWYTPKQQEMRTDPLLRWLYLQRSEILKTGSDPALASRLHIRRFAFPDDLPPEPPNAVGFFMGDKLGGIGWEIQLADGSRDKVYVALPEPLAQTWLDLIDAPDTHLGEQLPDRDIETVCTRYLAYLDGLLAEAHARFST